MNTPKRTLTNSTALRVVKNEKLLCENCLKSGPLNIHEKNIGDDEQAVYCYLHDEPKIKAKAHYCTDGLWLINGKAVDFKEGFQMVYDKAGVKHPKEIEI